MDIGTAFKGFWFIVNALIGLGVLGFIIWVILKLLAHFKIIG